MARPPHSLQPVLPSASDGLSVADDGTLQPHYAGFGDRAVAVMLDSLLLLLVLMVAGQVMEAVHPLALDASTMQAFRQDTASLPDTARFSDVLLVAHRYGMLEKIAFDFLVQLTMTAALVVGFWYRYRATPGKMLYGMKIADARTYAPARWWQLLLRFLGYAISALPLGLGFLWIGFNRRKRGWHDYLAGTVVLARPRKKHRWTPWRS